MRAVRNMLHGVSSLGLVFGRVLVLALLLGIGLPAHADTSLSLYKTYNGTVNFTGTQVTLRTKSNSADACAVASRRSNRTATLSLPSGATVLSAQLYWAGSGAADNTVTFQGKSLAATRKYSSKTVGNGMNYFGAAADVTATVKKLGAGTYTFSGLSVSNGRPWCASQAVLGGFSLLVIYSHKSEPERVLNLYEGFRYVQNGSVTLTANNFRWPTYYYPVRERARVGHITWEGDSTLLQDGERLLFEDRELSDDMNPAGNQFNSKSNINRDGSSYGIDFDAYDTYVDISVWREHAVTTTYRTGQDLVLLNAEILVLPSLPSSDLSIEMVRGGSMEVGQLATYTLVVANNGPYTEAGPVKVVDTLPAGMSFVSASGTNWNCAADGQVVTCTYSGALAPGDSAPALTLAARIGATGEMLNTAEVIGSSDAVKTNNVASDKATATQSNGNSNRYVFTSQACAVGKTPGTDDCPLYSGPMTGGEVAKIYVTAVNGGTTVAVNQKNDTAVSMQFSQTCVNPTTNAGVKASYAGAELPLCSSVSAPSAAAAAAWSAPVAMAFAANSASAALTAAQSDFSYADVGRVQLNLQANGVVASAAFVARPRSLAFRRIANAQGVLNPAAGDPSGLGFAAAGEEFGVTVGAVLGNGAFAPNFGRETTLQSVAIGASIPDAYNGSLKLGEMAQGVLARVEGGVAANLGYGEAGVVTLTPTLSDYLASGRVAGTSQLVGRFYPAYFETAAEAPFPCLPLMGCPDAPNDVSGAVYAGQPFSVDVLPFNAKGDQLENYVGAWRRPVTLSAIATQPGGNTVLPNLKGGALGVDGAGVPLLEGTPTYDVDAVQRYNADVASTGNLAKPTAIYIRATSTENVPVSVKYSTGKLTVSSQRIDQISAEAGVMVINGRLNVGSAQGVNTQRTPLRLQTEYWTGSAWATHSALDGVTIDPAGALFTGCTGSLEASSPRGSCNTHVGPVLNPLITLDNGGGAFWLRPPGSTRRGSVWVQMASPTWLPSTRGRVSFGAARSAFLYLRERY
ncbi:MAG: biosis protein MshQ [Massilia sp.]|jgi:uncharacterized repeat protein (TIGR01451 family)